MTIILSENGLYLRPFFLFRPGHPALLIPWNQLFDPQEKSQLFFKYFQITIGQPCVTTSSVPPSFYERIKVFMR